MKGIDVSAWQSIIDWDKVKAAGIEFAMIRIALGVKADSKAIRNIEECIRVGMPFGVYIYSYALNVVRAEQEAGFVIKMLKPYKDKISFPVVIDMEDADGYKTKHGMPSNETLVAICEKECLMFEGAGYYAAIYASKSWLDAKLKSTKLDRFDKWLAWWYKDAKFDKNKYGLWQCSDAGKVDGIRGSVDMNESFKDYPNMILKKEEDVMLNELIQKYGEDAVKNALVKLIESVNDDGVESDWAKEEYKEAKELGITDGINPEMFAKRQEVAIMVKRAVKGK